ncbi:replication initiator protein A [Sphingobium sp. CAP-1]|uniref:replication initiator protein A n=1 Tax=Sphingobium sp. CAP-1 TaxID=2676077 RepID=UPI003FA79EA9
MLTLNRRYFRLRKPLERRLYEIARKHCGFRPGKPVKFGLDTIQKNAVRNRPPKSSSGC